MREGGVIDYPDTSFVSFAYNDAGARTQMVDATGTTDYTYDELYRLTSVHLPRFAHRGLRLRRRLKAHLRHLPRRLEPGHLHVSFRGRTANRLALPRKGHRPGLERHPVCV